MAKKYLVIVSKFNELITKPLLEGALETFKEQNLSLDDVDTLWVPGSFEIPAVAAKAAKAQYYSAIICLGAVIRGETPHFEYVAGQAAEGLMRVGLDYLTPVIFGILTTDTVEQALNRAGVKYGNKGRDAVLTAVDMVKTMSKLDELVKR